MATITRRNAWNNGGTFANPDLFWYAKGVGVMQSRALDDPNSWWFFAAIHGQFVIPPDPARPAFPGWGFIPGPPQVPTTPLPAQDIQDRFWDQCQHQSWFFPPWHRGYLFALEAQIRAAVKELGGPADWALPYWNYFGPGNQFTIPPAFTEQNLPDGTPNPLFVRVRFGPVIEQYGDIFVELDTSGTPANPNGVNAFCQNSTVYTGFNPVTPTPGYGGPPTGFWHGGGTGGNLERNPHDLVHVDVGGVGLLTPFSVGLDFVNDLNAEQLSAQLRTAFQQNGIALSPQASVQVRSAGNFWTISTGGTTYFILRHGSTGMLDIGNVAGGGLMGNPGTAALDPIFYLHHANIDRMWAAWNENNSNTTNEFWVNGPAAIGQGQFIMPIPDTDPWVYTPTTVNNPGQLDYAYDTLDDMIVSQAPDMLTERLLRLGVASAVAETAQGANMDGGENVELLGANDRALQVTSSGVRTTVRLDADVRRRVFSTLASARATNSPDRLTNSLDRVYLHLENVRGIIDALKLNVVVNQQQVGTVALFGLQKASSQDGQHGGRGLAFLFDITDIVDNLFVANELDVDSLDVSIEPNNAFADLAQITVGRVSVYRQGQ